ncbi:hypothetical protein [Winogradskyella ouciana]|uniref:Uncharacterized protein n=1 Tax=Winogradskyella ouciana TaxID=2608631 RepID=A0A7K1GC38_9FLAO|nr:hypothetical protein [Winogradskyella ouciana]MTE25948.1 hypothetical protein [Winogradskyella ouciana]
MVEDLKKLFLRFNYSDENGFIVNAPTLNEGEHLSIGFDNKRKEFNIHFTDDNINEPGAKRRNFIFTMSAFRFFLFLNRFDTFYKHSIVNLILSSKTNLGKLKKHKFIVNTFVTSDEAEDKLIHKRKNGRHWKFRKNFDFDLIVDNFKYLEQEDLSSNKMLLAYKYSKGNLSLQGFIYNFEHLTGIYFIPIKKYNRFAKNIAIAMYNYLNTYPTEETLPFRQLMYERLKHPYLSKEEAKRMQR